MQRPEEEQMPMPFLPTWQNSGRAKERARGREKRIFQRVDHPVFTHNASPVLLLAGRQHQMRGAFQQAACLPEHTFSMSIQESPGLTTPWLTREGRRPGKACGAT